MISPTIRSNTSGRNTFSVLYRLWSRNRLWSNFVELQVRWCLSESRREQNISSWPLETDARLWFDIRIPCRHFVQLPTGPLSHRSYWTRVTLQPDTSIWLIWGTYRCNIPVWFYLLRIVKNLQQFNISHLFCGRCLGTRAAKDRRHGDGNNGLSIALSISYCPACDCDKLFFFTIFGLKQAFNGTTLTLPNIMENGMKAGVYRPGEMIIFNCRHPDPSRKLSEYAPTLRNHAWANGRQSRFKIGNLRKLISVAPTSRRQECRSITRTYMDDWLTMGPQQTFPIFSRQNILYWSFLAPRHRPDCLECHLSWAIAREAFRAVPQKFWISPKTFGRYYSPPVLKHKHPTYTHQTSMTVMHSVPGIALFPWFRGGKLIGL